MIEKPGSSGNSRSSWIVAAVTCLGVLSSVSRRHSFSHSAKSFLVYWWYLRLPAV